MESAPSLFEKSNPAPDKIFRICNTTEDQAMISLFYHEIKCKILGLISKG
jgi:hypothetical protein